MNSLISLYSEQARVSRLPRGWFQVGGRSPYRWWDPRQMAIQVITYIIMVLSPILVRRCTLILTSRGIFILKQPPTEAIADMNEIALKEYLYEAARQPGNTALPYATLPQKFMAKHWGSMIDCWGDVNFMGKWIFAVTQNRGTYLIAVPDASVDTLAGLSRDALYHLTGE